MVRWELVGPNPKLKLLDQVCEVMRLKHYSLRTKRSYCNWITRSVHFHGMKAREELLVAPEARMEQFLSDDLHARAAPGRRGEEKSAGLSVS